LTGSVACPFCKPTRVRRGVVLLLLVSIAGLVISAVIAFASEGESAGPQTRRSPSGVCPPFHLRDEDGNAIDPVAGKNADKPYSPKKTCGRCHDYQKITRGYHFTQGAGESPTQEQAARCLWASTPGNYGGTWCSPAPLYAYLSPKRNDSAATMDLTSFTFITKGCGSCHPGGGPVEFDREGKRYDQWMSDPASGFTPGGDNNFDGDYYRARWSKTGVLEADCLLCHLPEYNLPERKKQLGALNFRWAATAGAGFATVTGSTKEEKPVQIVYDKGAFNSDGTVSPHIVREPRNETCLSCHAKPGWKKRGANFRARTDVHLRAGLKCVDCHPAGSSAHDPRICGREQHQIGKGDDPGGHVRDDLDNTCVGCADCHDTGRLGAPIARHRWLPPLHLERIACQTCHIPERAVKSAQIVASDVFNPGAKIPTKGKHLWTFYGPDGKYWNHYGDLEMMGYDDKPTDLFRPVLARYKGKIYPVNRIHSAWPGIEVEGETALMQPKMGSVYKMWKSHQADPAKYPALAKIIDDNGDDVPEVNRPEEIDAVIQSVTRMLADTKYPMKGKRVVWVMDDRVYRSGTEYRTLDKETWEASPYANVHNYNHDVYPANAALGAKGCTECHHPDSEFFFAEVVKHPFDENANPITEPQYRLLGLSAAEAHVGAWREAYLKPTLYGTMVWLLLAGVVLFGGVSLQWILEPHSVPRWLSVTPWIAAVCLAVGTLLLLRQPNLMAYMLPTRFWLDSNHFSVAVIVMVAGVLALMWEAKCRVSGIKARRSRAGTLVAVELILSLSLAGVSGILMFSKIPGLDALTRFSYTLFDVSLAAVVVGVGLAVLRQATGQLTRHPTAENDEVSV